MRKYFFTGIALLFPLAITLAILIFIVNFLTQPFTGVVESFFNSHHLFDHDFLFLSKHSLKHIFAILIVLISLFCFTLLLGALTRWVLFHYFLIFGEKLVHKIPFIRAIYKIAKDVIKGLFNNSNQSFKQVVLIPFPSKDSYCLGLITNEDINSIEGLHAGLVVQPSPEALPLITPVSERVAIFIPTTPNPTSGFLVMAEKKDLIFIDVSVDEALKCVMSCGLTDITFKRLEPSV